MEAIIISIVSLVSVILVAIFNKRVSKSQAYKINEEGNNLAIKTANELITQMRQITDDYREENNRLVLIVKKLEIENKDLKGIVEELRTEIELIKCKMN